MYFTDPVNKASVDAITKSLFVVCLDQSIPVVNPSEDFNMAGIQVLHGGGSKQNSGNRWFDKTLQLIVNRNGINGINNEHSPCEGELFVRIFSFCVKKIRSQSSEISIIRKILPYRPTNRIYGGIHSQACVSILIFHEDRLSRASHCFDLI